MAEKRSFKKYKAALNPFATTYALWTKEIESMSTRRLNYLLKSGEKLSLTNCWWATYEVFPILSDIIEQELRRRKLSKKKK